MLADTVKKFEGLFKAVKQKPEHNKEIPLIWSGGTTGFLGTPPVLYSDSDHAISSWRTWAMAAWNEKLSSDNMKLTLEWYIRPELIEYQITIADKIGRHRMVNNRWAVKSQFKVING